MWETGPDLTIRPGCYRLVASSFPARTTGRYVEARKAPCPPCGGPGAFSASRPRTEDMCPRAYLSVSSVIFQIVVIFRRKSLPEDLARQGAQMSRAPRQHRRVRDEDSPHATHQEARGTSKTPLTGVSVHPSDFLTCVDVDLVTSTTIFGRRASEPFDQYGSPHRRPPG